MPTVSVIIPSYNHEAFIEECIQSVLNQTFQDFEIVITDDGSIDRTVQIIESFDDPRISLFKHPVNKGACLAANNCIVNSKGKYVAMLSSDDAWYPDKLDIQVKFLDAHPNIAAVFGRVDWVDESGKLIVANCFPFMNVFNEKNKNRFEWLGYFFSKGNCLCHPSSLVRRECYTEVGLLNPAMASIPDLDFWVRICLKYDIAILDKEVIRFRRMNDESNASGNTCRTQIRSRLEYRQILNHYLRIIDPDEFLLIFPETVQYGRITAETIPYFLGRIAIDTGIDFRMVWGLDVIFGLLQKESAARALEVNCDFTYLDFIRLAAACDVFGISNILTTQFERRSSFRIFLSASKRYLTEIYLIIKGRN